MGAESGEPALWFVVFWVASFLYAGTLYGLSALLFIACVSKDKVNKKLVYGVPAIIFVLSLLAFATTALAQVYTMVGALLGWAVAFVLHQWLSNKFFKL